MFSFICFVWCLCKEKEKKKKRRVVCQWVERVSTRGQADTEHSAPAAVVVE